jgi:hypothetical protein
MGISCCWLVRSVTGTDNGIQKGKSGVLHMQTAESPGICSSLIISLNFHTNRKIQCDETHPTCLRCAKAKRRCTGYYEDADSCASQKMTLTVHKQRTPGYTIMKLPPVYSSERPFYLKNASNWSLTPISEPNFDLIPAINEVIHEFSYLVTHMVPKAKVFGGWLLYVPTLLPRLDPSASPLLAAIQAVYFLIESFRLGHDFISPESVFYHSKALSLLRRSLSSMNKTPSQELLMASLVLNFYEVRVLCEGIEIVMLIHYSRTWHVLILRMLHHGLRIFVELGRC